MTRYPGKSSTQSAQRSDDGEYELSYYARVLRRRAAYVLAPVIVLALAGFLTWSRPTPVYKSTAEVLAEPSISGANGSGTQIETEVAIIGSDRVRNAAEKTLNREVSVSVAQVSADSGVARITATSADRAHAQEDASTYASTYVEVRRRQSGRAASRARKGVESEIDDINGEVRALNDLIGRMDTMIAAESDDAVRHGLENQRKDLLQRRSEAVASLQPFEVRLADLRVAASLNPSLGVEVISDATEAVAKRGPGRRQVTAAAAGVGLVLGLLLAFAREHLDRSVRSGGDLRGAAVLARVPHYRGRRYPEVLVSEPKRGRIVAESFRRLRTSVLAAAGGTRNRVVLVASPCPGDGSTSTAVGLAVVLARSGRRVLLVDADVRKPRVHKVFGLSGNDGLTGVLTSDVTPGDAAVAVPEVPNLEVLPSGEACADPAALFSSDRARRVFKNEVTGYEVIVVDGPPLLPVSDGIVLAELADSVILVARHGRTRRDDIVTANSLLDTVEAVVLGYVLNDVPAKAAGVSRYGSHVQHRDGRPGSSYVDLTGGAPAARSPESSTSGAATPGASSTGESGEAADPTEI